MQHKQVCRDISCIGVCACAVELTVPRARLFFGVSCLGTRACHKFLGVCAGAVATSAGLSGSGRRASLDGECDRRLRLPFTTRNAMLLRAIPTFRACPCMSQPCTACCWSLRGMSCTLGG